MEDRKLKIAPKPPKGEDGYKTFSIRIKDEMVQKLDDVILQTGHNRNQLITMLLEYGLENIEIEK